MNKVENIRDEFEEVKQSQKNAYELAIYTLEQNNKRERFIIKILVAIIIALLAINAYWAYLWSDTEWIETTMEEWTQDGDYNIYNKDGSLVNGDYPNGDTNLQENNN